MTSTTTFPVTLTPTAPGLLDALLTRRSWFREQINDADAQPQVLPRLLMLAAASLAIFGGILGGVLYVTGATPDWMLPKGTATLGLGPAVTCALAYPLGMLGAIGICLPSLWFYALQLGFRPSLRRIVMNSLAGQLSTGVYLLGLLPFYAALVLGMHVLGKPAADVHFAAQLGLALPLLAGLYGVREVRGTFKALAGKLPSSEVSTRPFAIGVLSLWSATLFAVIAPCFVVQLLCSLGQLALL